MAGLPTTWNGRTDTPSTALTAASPTGNKPITCHGATWRAGLHQLTLQGFVSPTYWNNILAECDGDDDADYFRVRVKGQKPRSAMFSIIKTHWVESAQERHSDADSLNDPVVIGLDFGLTSDKHGMAVRQGFNMLDGQEWLPKEDPEQVTLEAAERAIDAQELFNARYIIGDSNGVGTGRHGVPDPLLQGTPVPARQGHPLQFRTGCAGQKTLQPSSG